MPGDPQTETLESIDAKLGAILALTIDTYLRETEIAEPKPRSIDRMLKDAGLANAQIARMLGKTRQAVGEQLKKG